MCCGESWRASGGGPRGVRTRGSARAASGRAPLGARAAGLAAARPVRAAAGRLAAREVQPAAAASAVAAAGAGAASAPAEACGAAAGASSRQPACSYGRGLERVCRQLEEDEVLHGCSPKVSSILPMFRFCSMYSWASCPGYREDRVHDGPNAAGVEIVTEPGEEAFLEVDLLCQWPRPQGGAVQLDAFAHEQPQVKFNLRATQG